MEPTNSRIDATRTEEYAEAFFYHLCLTCHSSLSLLLGKREPNESRVLDKFLVDMMKNLTISRDIIFQKKEDDSTPLHYVCKDIAMPCAWRENSVPVNIAKLLIEAGADINAKDIYGWTPFHYAALKTLDRAFLGEVFGESLPVNSLSPWRPHEFAHLKEQKGQSPQCYKDGYCLFVKIYRENRLDPDFLVPRFSNELICDAFLSNNPAYNKEDLEGIIKTVEDSQKIARNTGGCRL